MSSFFDNHVHTHYSNIRLLDSINRPKSIIDKAIELGLEGIAITDHECISSHMEVNQYSKEIKEKYPNFKIALGNEIYLVDKRENGIKYYHFILIAKDEIGHKQLRKLSSKAWLNSYFDRGLERVPLLKEELKEIIGNEKGHLIATTACLGGEIGSCLLMIQECEDVFDNINAHRYYLQIHNFIEFCKEMFNDDFYIEVAPAKSNDQIMVNKKLLTIANNFNIKLCIGSDSHYPTKENRYVHKAYLNSKGGEREVDSFYEYAHLMSADEARENLKASFDDPAITEIFNNSLEIKNKIKDYSLEHKQIIPKVEVIDYKKTFIPYEWFEKYPVICELIRSDEIQERYWINECIKGLQEKDLYNDEYLARLEIEADIIKHIGGELNDCLFAYFNTFKHYIDLFWECGSIVGPGRGSATGFLSNYLLGITQLNPVRWGLPYWRFLFKARANLPDIDIDLASEKRPLIIKKIREERGELGLVQVATFGTEGTKSAILTACRGYRSDEYPDGIDVDQAQYMSALIPQERGMLWDIKDVVYGNPDKNRKPVSSFIREVNYFPGLLDIIIQIVGLINKRSSHASGIILYDEDPYKTASFMRTPKGEIITCYNLHDAEAAGDTKYDFLITEISDKIIHALDMLAESGEIENLSLRERYNKYIHPEVLDTTDPLIWEHLAAGDILDVFQFNSGAGLAIAKKLKPKNPVEMTAANAISNIVAIHFTC